MTENTAANILSSEDYAWLIAHIDDVWYVLMAYYETESPTAAHIYYRQTCLAAALGASRKAEGKAETLVHAQWRYPRRLRKAVLRLRRELGAV